MNSFRLHATAGGVLLGLLLAQSAGAVDSPASFVLPSHGVLPALAGGGASSSGRRLKSIQATRQVGTGNTSQQLLQKLPALLVGADTQRGNVALTTTPISSRQHAALAELNLRVADGVRAHFDVGNGTPTFLRGALTQGAATRSTGDASRTARAFLRDNAELLKLAQPGEEMQLLGSRRGADGRSHLRYQQTWQGVPVWGQQALVHLDGSGEVYLFNGRYAPSPQGLDTQPGISAGEAGVIAVAAMAEPSALDQGAELVVHLSTKGEPRLAWKVDVQIHQYMHWFYFVDAKTGDILHRLNNVQTAGSIAPASGIDLLGQRRNFNSWSENGLFYMIDPSTPDTDASYDPLNSGPNDRGDTFIFDARNTDGSQGIFGSTSAQEHSGWDPTAVSAMANTMTVFDYYKTAFNRHSIDGEGMNLLAVVHYKQDFGNAFWSSPFMVYGDGDSDFEPLAKCNDVVAHEMTHGVIEKTAGLIYENQSGALNESFADVFAAMVDRDDWLVGEDCTLAAPGFLRNLANPAQGLSPQPTKMSEYRNMANTPETDKGGVHVNSGIPNRAAYLLAEGLAAEGLGSSIGKAKVEQIYYRALTTYLTASARFIDARRAVIQAAEDLHGAGSAEALAAAAAWDEVEVVEGGSGQPGDNSPTSADPVVGDDAMIYLFPEDGSHDSAVENFALYVQNFTRNSLVGPWNTVWASHRRPAVFTSMVNGVPLTSLYYVGTDNNLYVVSPDGSNQQITNTQNIWSISLSPDGRQFAYTTANANDNYIYLVDFESGVQRGVELLPEDYQEGSSSQGNAIFYADSLAFDYSGGKLVFDVLNCTPIPASPCDPNVADSGYRYWSIGIVNVSTNQLNWPYPGQSPLFDLGNPVFAANNDFVIAFDVHDNSEIASTGSGRAYTYVANLETGEENIVMDFGPGSAPSILSFPSFWGGDDFVTVQQPSGDAGVITAAKVPLDNWAAAGPPERINDFAVAVPLMTRLGERQLQGTLQLDRALLDFGQMVPGEQKSLPVTLSNTGNRDVEVTGIALDNAQFGHNGLNSRLPRGQSMSIWVSFTADSTAGTTTGNLRIAGNGDPAELNVSVSAVVSPRDDGDDGGGGGGGGLGVIALLLLGSAGLRQRRRVTLH